MLTSDVGISISRFETAGINAGVANSPCRITLRGADCFFVSPVSSAKVAFAEELAVVKGPLPLTASETLASFPPVSES